MSFIIDNNLTPVPGTANVTASSAASANAVRVPPGEHSVLVLVPQAATGTAPTCTIEIQDSPDGTTFSSLKEPRIYTVDATQKQQYVFHNVRIVQQGAVGTTVNNLGVNIVVSGTTPNFGKVLVAVIPPGSGTAFQGRP